MQISQLTHLVVCMNNNVCFLCTYRMLLGAASLLKKWEGSIKGTVRFMFQPAEEGGAGGKRMIEEGILEQDPKPKHGFGMHVWPT